jgi:hypothetical protein
MSVQQLRVTPNPLQVIFTGPQSFVELALHVCIEGNLYDQKHKTLLVQYLRMTPRVIFTSRRSFAELHCPYVLKGVCMYIRPETTNFVSPTLTRETKSAASHFYKPAKFFVESAPRALSSPEVADPLTGNHYY